MRAKMIAAAVLLSCAVSHRVVRGPDDVVEIHEGMTCAAVEALLGRPHFLQPDKFAGATRWVYQFSDLRFSAPEYRFYILRFNLGELQWVRTQRSATPWRAARHEGAAPCPGAVSRPSR